MGALNSFGNGRFLVAVPLGEGGMARVFRVWDTRLEVWRALKVMLPEYANKKALRTRFRAEAQAMAALEHPNIVRVYDVVDDGDLPYIVMELLTGGALENWVESHGPMPPRLAAEVILQVCAGVHAAHAKSVVHRDLKPANILVGQDSICRIADFGIARVQDGSRTRTGLAMGTLGYMAPEQAANSKSVDGRADVYSIGATMYHLLTAEVPAHLFFATEENAFEKLPSEFVDVIRRATQFRREDRHGSVDELTSEIQQLLPELPPVPISTPPLPRAATVEPPIPRPESMPARTLVAVEGGSDVQEPVSRTGSITWIGTPRPAPPLEETAEAKLSALYQRIGYRIPPLRPRPTIAPPSLPPASFPPPSLPPRSLPPPSSQPPTSLPPNSLPPASLPPLPEVIGLTNEQRLLAKKVAAIREARKSNPELGPPPPPPPIVEDVVEDTLMVHTLKDGLDFLGQIVVALLQTMAKHGLLLLFVMMFVVGIVLGGGAKHATGTIEVTHGEMVESRNHLISTVDVDSSLPEDLVSVGADLRQIGDARARYERASTAKDRAAAAVALVRAMRDQLEALKQRASPGSPLVRNDLQKRLERIEAAQMRYDSAMGSLSELCGSVFGSTALTLGFTEVCGELPRPR